MKNFLVITLIVFGLLSCKSGKKSSASTAESACAVKIKFASIGSGIDAVAYDDVKRMIDSKKLKYSEKNMGREGEKEICLSLGELKSNDKTEFIAQLKKRAADAQYVSVSTD